MALYTNNTRFPSIVTIKVLQTGDPKATLTLGDANGNHDELAAEVGIIDIMVPSGKCVELAEGTLAEFLAARTV